MALVKCKVKRNFGLHQSFVAGEVREFTEEELRRLTHLIEPVNSVSSENKMYKKGKKKTK